MQQHRFGETKSHLFFLHLVPFVQIKTASRQENLILVIPKSNEEIFFENIFEGKMKKTCLNRKFPLPVSVVDENITEENWGVKWYVFWRGINSGEGYSFCKSKKCSKYIHIVVFVKGQKKMIRQMFPTNFWICSAFLEFNSSQFAYHYCFHPSFLQELWHLPPNWHQQLPAENAKIQQILKNSLHGKKWCSSVRQWAQYLIFHCVLFDFAQKKTQRYSFPFLAVQTSTLCVIFRQHIKFVFFFAFLVAPCCSQGATLQVTLRCCPLSVRDNTPPFPQEMWFLGSSGNFKQLSFLGKKFFKIFFSPKIFFHLQKNFPTFNFLCISGCFMPSWLLKKNFTQNFFGWSKARHNATKHF